MFNLIEKLRQKPDHTKKRVAFLSAFLLAGIIFVIWLSVIYPDFKQKQEREEVVSKLEPSPLGTFGETFRTGASAIRDQFINIKESIESITTNSTYYSTTTEPLIISTSTIEQ